MIKIRKKEEKERQKKKKKKKGRRNISRVLNLQEANRDLDRDHIQEYPKKKGNKQKENREFLVDKLK